MSHDKVQEWCDKGDYKIFGKYRFFPCKLGVFVRVTKLPGNELRMDLLAPPLVVPLNRLPQSGDAIDWKHDPKIRQLVFSIIMVNHLVLDDPQTLTVSIRRRKLLKQEPLHS